MVVIQPAAAWDGKNQTDKKFVQDISSYGKEEQNFMRARMWAWAEIILFSH